MIKDIAEEVVALHGFEIYVTSTGAVPPNNCSSQSFTGKSTIKKHIPQRFYLSNDNIIGQVPNFFTTFGNKSR